MDDELTIDGQVQLALAAYAELTSLGEDIEDEWSYVNDLSTSWQERLEELVATRGNDAAGAAEQAAVERAIDEIGRITDPHRAIDWLSTFPQVVLLTFGETA
jgi:hypothetical protein